jgi:hypothetical protein
LIRIQARRGRDNPTINGREYMKVTKLLGFAALGGLLMLAVPADRAQAMSLASPGVAATVQGGSQQATQVGWRRHWHRHHWRRWRR